MIPPHKSDSNSSGVLINKRPADNIPQYHNPKTIPSGENALRGINAHLIHLCWFDTPQEKTPPPAPRADLEAPNTKPLLQILAKNKEKLNKGCTLKVQAFIDLPDNYRNPTFPKLLADRIQYGTKIGYTGPPSARTRTGNLQSASLDPNNITREIAEELSLGRLQQVDQLPSKHYCSPIGLTPKRKQGIQTGWRRIFHLSSPKDNSVNDHIPRAYGTLAYETFSNAVKSTTKSGKGSILLKRDLKSAFRKIPVCNED